MLFGMCCQNDCWYSAHLVKAGVSVAVRLLAAKPNGQRQVQAPPAWL